MSKLKEKLQKLAKKRAIKRPVEQVAAICTRVRHGKREVLLITSRETGRWVIPKGWPMKGLSDADAAAVEAWEEAGIAEAKHDKKPVGYYKYRKKLDDGTLIPVKVAVFRLKVQDTSKSYPENKQRRRKWVSPKNAAAMVREPGLKKLLGEIKKKA